MAFQRSAAVWAISDGGFRLLGGRLGLAQLLVHFGRVQFGEQVSFMHQVADIDEPAFHVAAGARVDRGLLKGLEGARQGKFHFRRGEARQGIDDDALVADFLLPIRSALAATRGTMPKK